MKHKNVWDPVRLICCAIAQKEGYFVEDSIPQLRNNPGDLDYAGQLGAFKVASTAPDPDIAAFQTKQLGIAAIFRQVWLQVAEGQSLQELITQWDSADPTYLPDVVAWTGLPVDVPILTLLPDLTKIA